MGLSEKFRALCGDEPASVKWKSVDSMTNFDITAVEDIEDLLLIPMRVLMRFNLHNKYNIDMEVWTTFSEKIRDNMNDNKYHNLRHITDVVQTLGSFLAARCL